MEQFVTLQAVAVPLIEPNVNTDDILPSVWVLNANTNLGEKLFANRYKRRASPKEVGQRRSSIKSEASERCQFSL